MAMTMQGEVALQTVDTVVRATPGLPAHSSAHQRFEKVSDGALKANNARGRQTKSKLARDRATFDGRGSMRVIDLASRDGLSLKADTSAIATATHLSTTRALARVLGMVRFDEVVRD